MVDIIKSIITNVLTALYQPFGFSVLLAVLLLTSQKLSYSIGVLILPSEEFSYKINVFRTFFLQMCGFPYISC